MAKQLHTTPRGVWQYPYLNRPNTKFDADGVYKVDHIVDAEEATDLIALIDERMEADYKEALANEKSPAKRKRLKQADPPYEEQDDGKILFKFRNKAGGISKKTKKPWSWQPSLFDRFGRRIKLDAFQIGGGTEGKVSFEFNTNTLKGEVFTSLRLQGAQVIELVEFGGGNADYFGFGEEEGSFDAETYEPVAGPVSSADEEDTGVEEEEDDAGDEGDDATLEDF